jgi:hypothetical protein
MNNKRKMKKKKKRNAELMALVALGNDRINMASLMSMDPPRAAGDLALQGYTVRSHNIPCFKYCGPSFCEQI